MAIVRKRDENIKDLVAVEKSEAVKYQVEIIQAWKPQHEVWSIRYSPTILGGLAALSCIFINGHYRKKLRLYHYGRMASYLPTVVIPSITGALAHSVSVQSDLLLRDVGCPVCIEMRSALLQSIVSIFYPLLLSPLANLGLASKFKTSIVPNLFSTKGRMLAIQTWWTYTKPITNTLLGLVLLQGLAASTLTIMQLNAISKVDRKIAEIVAEEENES